MDLQIFEKEKNTIIHNIVGQSDWETASVTDQLNKIVHLDQPYNVKFKILDICGLLRDNVQERDDFSLLTSALKILRKYGRNLQKREELRPPMWHTIMYSNGIFKNSVDTVRGARDVLKTLGYKDETAMGLCFVKNTQPDPLAVALVITELLIALAEIEQYVTGHAAYPSHIENLISPAARVQQQQTFSRSVISPEEKKSELERKPRIGEGAPKVMTIAGKTEPCDICGSSVTSVVCETCNSKWLCDDCDQRYHGHPRRLNHVKYKIVQATPIPRRRGPEESSESLESGIDENETSGNVSIGKQMYSTELSTGADQMQRLSGIEHSGVQNISTSQLPMLSGVFNANNSTELLSNQPIPAAAKSIPTEKSVSGDASYPEFSLINPGTSMLKGQGQLEIGLDFKQMLLGSYKGPTCNLLSQVMTVSPLEKQKEILDMCILKLQIGVMQKAATSESNVQLIRNQLVCLTQYRQHWEMVEQKHEELSCSNHGQNNSSEKSNSSGNVTFVININSHMNQMQNQEINVSNAAQTTLVSGPMNSQTSFEGPAPVIPLHIEQSESSSYNTLASTTSAFQDINPKPTYANETNVVNSLCQICQRLTKSDTPFCQHCGNGIERPGSEEMLGFGIGQERFGLTPQTKSSPMLWQCEHCTFRNHPDSLACEMCQRVTDSPLWISDEPEEVKPVPLNKHKIDETELAQDIPRYQKELSIRLPQDYPGFFDEQEPSSLAFNLPRNSQLHSLKDFHIHQPVKEVEAPRTRQNPNDAPSRRKSMMQETESGFVYNLMGGDMTQMILGGVSPGAGESVSSIVPSVKEDDKLAENQARLLAGKIRDAEMNNYSLEEFEIAMEKNRSDDPINWLSVTWDHIVIETKTILEALTLELDKAKFFFTEKQIRAKLAACDGDVDKASSELVSERQNILEHLDTLGSFSEEEILQALHDCHGDKDKLENHIVNTFLSEFRSTIWEADPDIDDNLEKVIRDKNTDAQRRGRLVLVEGFLKSWGRVETVLYLLDYAELDPSITLDDIFDAANECGHKAATLQYLQQECQICFSSCSRNKIMNLTHCQCQVCKPCMQEYFEVVIRERPVRDLVCPVCLQPDIQDPEQSQQHFQFLDLLLKGLVEDGTWELYQRKVRDWILMQDPQFRWCSHCDSGFLFHPEEGGDDLQMTCPQCGKQTCYNCKRPWEDQHAGLTCDQFIEWKIANDPEHQALGLARHLQENGIECPSCKFRYVLSRGGCMHFKCTQCHHEFCSGCYKPFKRQNCQFLRSCAHAGLHCHHPRDCLFYLRDYEIDELQTLLKESSVTYKEDLLYEDHTGENCPVVEQKETSSGLLDEACGREVATGHAGLCLLHYKEYLVDLVNRHNLDPVSIMTTDQLELQLKKYEKAGLKKKSKESQTAFHKRMISHVQNQIPLVKKSRKSNKNGNKNIG